MFDISDMVSGLDPSRLEQKLWKWFRMAEEWQAVLLIDEADVYLEQRGIGGSLERDAIVAGKSDWAPSSSADNRLILCQSSFAPLSTIAGFCSSRLTLSAGLMRRFSAASCWSSGSKIWHPVTGKSYGYITRRRSKWKQVIAMRYLQAPERALRDLTRKPTMSTTGERSKMVITITILLDGFKGH